MSLAFDIPLIRNNFRMETSPSTVGFLKVATVAKTVETTKNFFKDLQQDIKIGIKTKGYEQEVKGSNLVISIGFIGRCTNYEDNKVKIKVEDVVNLLTTKRVGMVKPEALSTENLAGLEWDLEDFAKRTEKVIPKSSLVYQNTIGKTSIRFIDYKKNNIQESEEYQEELT